MISKHSLFKAMMTGGSIDLPNGMTLKNVLSIGRESGSGPKETSQFNVTGTLTNVSRESGIVREMHNVTIYVSTID